ncbi:hypothetical protein H6P81_021372 [Aristolochia fimbriata]|uniref:Uncharacterized protein n=1 Tax=Aristolochia fimbriata TaxID=158543 RepID=A0AAV7DQ35_ARIFI|nr:hypothetical protein H6P81_021372 [Aristolochia fimbriata]
MGLNLSGSWQQGHSATYNTRRPRRLVVRPGASPTTACPWGRKAPNVGRQAGGEDVPPQPNSPPDNVFRPGFRRRIPLVVPVLSRLFGAGEGPKGGVPDPSPSPRRGDQLSPGGGSFEQSTDSPAGWDWDPVPSPQSQSFSRIYGSILPTSLAYIVPSTRGCSPWRPDAVMSTTRRGRLSVLGFSRAPGGYPDHQRRRGALPAAGPYLRLSRFRICTGGRSAQARRPVFGGSRRPSYSSRPGCCPAAGLAQLGTVTRAFGSSRIASSVTKNGPLGALDSVRGSAKQPRSPTYLKFENRTSRARAPAILRETGGNQLLDGSISLSPLYPSQASDLPRRYRCGPPPEVSSGRPLRHSSPSFGSRQVGRRCSPLEDPANQLPSLPPYGFGRPLASHTCQTPWSVFQGGSNGEPAGPAPKAAQVPRGNASVVVAPPSSVTEAAYRGAGSSAGLGSPVTSVGRRPSRRRTGSRRPALDRRIARPHPLPSRQFQALFDSLFKVLFIFPSRYLLAIGLSPLALGRNLPPYLGCIPKQPDFADSASRCDGVRAAGLSPSLAPHSMGLAPGPSRRAASANYNSSGESRSILILGLFGLARPLLGESFGCSHLTWGANPSKASVRGGNCRQGSSSEPGPRTRPSPRGAREGGATTRRAKCPWGKVFSANLARGARTTNLLAPRRPPRRRQRWGQQSGGGGRLRRAWRPGRCTLDLVASGATCVQRLRWFAGFCNSHQVSRIRFVLHRSREPRYPLPRVVLGYRVESGPPRASSFAWHRSRPVVVRVFASRTVAGAGAETRRRPVAKRRGFDGRFAPGRARRPAGHRSVDFIALSAANRQASPAIEHFTDHSIGRAAGAELTRQIAPPTKSGHAPPPIESRKSSQSVNPYYVWTCTEAATRPVKARGASPGRGGRVDLCTHLGGPIDQPKTLRAGIVIYCHYLPVSGLGNFLAPAAFLGCGSRFSGSLSESNPNSPSPVNTMVGPYPTIES